MFRQISSRISAKQFATLASTAAGVVYVAHQQTADSQSTLVASAARAPSMMYSWGSNQFGQLGLGSENKSEIPVAVNYLYDAAIEPVFVTCGGHMTGIISNDGEVFTCGMSVDGNIENQTTPEDLPLPDNCKAVSMDFGQFHGVVVGDNGKLYTWGRGRQGQLGHNNPNPGTASAVESDVTFMQASCGRNHTAAVSKDGELYTWGFGKEYALGHGDKAIVERPEKIELSGKVKKVACGDESTLVLMEDGSVFTCGRNGFGQLGLGTSVAFQVRPKKVRSLGRVKVADISSGEFHAACISEDGELFTWGAGKDGQLGHGSREDLSVPTRVELFQPEDRIAQVACGGGHTAVVTDTGKLYCFGRGRHGQIGRADELESVAAYRTEPQEIVYFKGQVVEQVACGADHTVAIAN